MPFCTSFGLKVDGVLYDSKKGLERPDLKQALADGAAFKVQKGLADMRMESMAADLKKLFDGLKEFKPTVLMYGTLSRAKSLIYSIEYKVPALAVELQVMVPVSDKAPAGLPNLPCGANGVWFKLLMAGASKALPQLHAAAQEGLGLDVSDKITMPYMTKFFYDIPSLPSPMFYGISGNVIPIHPEWPTCNFHVCGFFVVDKQTQEQLVKENASGAEFGAESNDELTRFLATGTPPVYMGWGSMLCKSPEWMVKIALESLKHVGARGVLLGGWSGIGLEAVPAELQDYCKENVLFVKSAAHEWLFPQCSCIVHHGGSGTTAASVRSGKPTIITPIMGDQFDFADGINEVGCGVGLPKFGNITSQQLGDAIKRCLDDQGVIQAAAEVGAKVRAENGCENFCKVFDEWYTSQYQSGEWLRKHNQLLQSCKQEAASGSCTVQ